MVQVEVQSETESEQNVPHVRVVRNPRIPQSTEQYRVVVRLQLCELGVGEGHPVPEIALRSQVPLHQFEVEVVPLADELQ
jgi:hypothetical protein